jgi:hypothetical protein
LVFPTSFFSRRFFLRSAIGVMGNSSLRFLFGIFPQPDSYTIAFAAGLPAALFCAARAAFVLLEESKVVSSYPHMLNSRPVLRTILFALLLPVFCAAHASLAYGQDFSLTASSISPPAVNPGQNATSIIDLTATGGFDSSVSLTCTVTASSGATTNLPLCVVSPASQTPPANGPALTVSTFGAQPGQYEIIVTGTSGSMTHQTPQLILNVQDVPEDYTVTISKAISPTSVPAGLGASATITITPIGSYTGTVYLYCLSVTPVETATPYCSFAATQVSTSLPPNAVQIGSDTPATSVLTINTFGPAATTTATAKPSKLRGLQGLWLGIPALALIGIGASGSRRKKFLWLMLLMLVAGGLLLMPACNSTTNNGSTAPNGDITPDETYAFTVSAVDQNGIAPSNNSSASEAATVSLTVTKAP